MAPVWADGDPGVEGALYGIPFLFNVLYYLFVILILSAIISGIIIDSFGELRGRNAEIQEDINDKCFICDLSRDELDSGGGASFASHIKRDHNMWDYVFFLTYLQQKPSTEYTGQESYVASMHKDSNVKFFPIKRALSIERST